MRTQTFAFVLCTLLVACKPGVPPTEPSEPIDVDYAAAPLLEPVAGEADDRPFYVGAYDPAIATPKSILGELIGAHPAPPEKIILAFRTWSEQSKRASISTYATTYEGRELVRIIVSSETNMARIEEIKAAIAKLADPRGLSASEQSRIIKETPAVAWMGYSIHGNEMSGADASLAFGYHIIAGTNPDVADLLDKVVIIIDPVLNPDGRTRAITTIRESASFRPNENYASMHRWKWPGGRGNHYLFDLNRDWLTGTHPETRGRWKVIGEWNPQLIIDAHEMGATDTFLFSPKNAPYNPNLPKHHHKWYRAFSNDLGQAFDRRGWAYYTREWADGWFPGYTTTWGQLLGGLTFLYEQSSTRGLPLRRPSGKRVTYRESVRGHAISSLVNVQTLAANREAMLKDYVAHKLDSSSTTKHRRAFAFAPGKNPDRERAILEIALRNGLDVFELRSETKVRNAVSRFGGPATDRKLPAKTIVIPEAQPLRALVRALFEFDPRFIEKDLADEREEIERNGSSKIYDVTAWNLGHAFDLNAYWIDNPTAARMQITKLRPLVTGIVDEGRVPYGWVVGGHKDASVAFAARALELGLQVHVADKPFERASRKFVRGSVLIRVSENPKNAAELITAAATFTGVSVVPVATGRSAGDGPDLGGGHFRRLVLPRIAIAGSLPISASKFGHLWYHLDRELKVPATMLGLGSIKSTDLRRYNVLILPDAWGSMAAELKASAPVLSAWIKNGGTLIAMGAAAEAVADAKLPMSKVRRRRDSLEMLGLYDAATKRNIDSRTVTIDEREVWQGKSADAESKTSSNIEMPTVAGGPKPTGKEKKPTPAEQRDAWERRFAPQGAMLNALVDTESWLTFGTGDRMPVLFAGSTAFLATSPVRVAVRLGPADGLRLSGLLWPEARRRLAHTAYSTIERSGAGQVILFAGDPVFRGATRGAARLLSNAVVYGPGVGTSQPDVW